MPDIVDDGMTPMPYGRCLDGRFTICEPLGAGAMGTVYRAIQHPFDREVAVKVLDPQMAEDSPHLVKRFLREARLAGRIAHPNVMAILDLGQTEDGILYIAAELLRGRTLAQALRERRTFSASRTVAIGIQLSAALAAAQEHGIIHRDLKPENIMLLDAEEDAVRVLDFGVAKSLAALRAGTQITSLNFPIGTPAYMAPEIASGRPAEPRSDLYSLGMVLYQMLSGGHPFNATSRSEMLARQILESPPPLIGCCPGPLANLVMDLLAKEPSQRPATALRVLDALLEMQGPGTITLPWERRASSR